MPTHVYQPRNTPPTLWDRLMVHPTDTVIAVATIVLGVVALFGLAVELTVSKSLEQIPAYLVVLIAGFLAAGGAAVLVGLYWNGEDISTGWALERFGWLFIFGGFGTYAAAVMWRYPESVFSWALPLTLCAASILRFVSILLIERGTRDTIAEVGGGIL